MSKRGRHFNYCGEVFAEGNRMWKVFVRAIIAFAFSIFGRTFIALVVAMLLSFATALLIDFRMYVSAGLAGVLALAAVALFVIQYRRQIVASRRRSKQQAEAAQRREASAEARSEKMGKAKAAVADTVKGMTASAADAAKTGFAGARGRIQGWRK
jgi:membrane protein implicated in regulation of membrane protease activity